MTDGGDPGASEGRHAGTIEDVRSDLAGLRRRITHAVRRHCPVWLAGQIEDIAQNAILRLLRTLEKSDGNRTFSAVYVEKSVSGAVVDEIRRACRRRESPVEDLEAVAPADVTHASPEQQAGAREIARGILECLGGLIRPRRVAVALYLHGCTVPEAAGRLGWSLRRTESLVYRGLANLRQCLERKGLKP